MNPVVNVAVADRVALVTLDRPPMNALSTDLIRSVGAALTECGQREDVGAVVIYGGPKVFAAGADIKEMAGTDRAAIESFTGDLMSALNAVAECPKPVIAAITGYALGGGCELALACDLRVAAADARLGQPEILLGIIPGAGGTQRLARLIGPARAKDLVFSGRFVAADEALRIGLIDRVAEADGVLDDALAWARQLARGPALAMAAAKRAIDEGLSGPLDAGLRLERSAFVALFGTEDQQIGMASFVEHGPGRATFVHR